MRILRHSTICSNDTAPRRVCEVKLDGNHGVQLRQQKYKVSDALKTGDAHALFGTSDGRDRCGSGYTEFAPLTDYMADSVDSFLTQIGSHVEDDDALHLGFTFSFPVEQTALDSGTLLTWTKGFSAKNAQGNDVVKMLQDAFDRKHLHVKCTALVNDVSTSVSL